MDNRDRVNQYQSEIKSLIDKHVARAKLPHADNLGSRLDGCIVKGLELALNTFNNIFKDD